MPMKAPPHPGLSVRLDCLEPIDLSVTEAAKALGVTRQALNDVVNGKAGISPDMATTLSASSRVAKACRKSCTRTRLRPA